MLNLVNLRGDIPNLQLSEKWVRLAEEVIDSLNQFVVPHYDSFRAGVIHNDVNDWNILLRSETSSTISGMIDWSDCIHSFVVCELATTMGFFALHLTEPGKNLLPLVRGYTSELELLPVERETLFYWTAGRLVMAPVLCLLQYQKDPTNSGYLLNDVEPSFVALEKLLHFGKEAADKLWWGGNSRT